jgi:hypothetical protein
VLGNHLIFSTSTPLGVIFGVHRLINSLSGFLSGYLAVLDKEVFNWRSLKSQQLHQQRPKKQFNKDKGHKSGNSGI